MNNQIQSQLEIISIKMVIENSRYIKDSYFSDFELKDIDNKHPQTLAGFYAVKIALKKIINKAYPKHRINEKQIILMHRTNGAPCIKEIKFLQDKDIGKFFISISHTSENAYGFASLKESIK